VIQDPHAQGSDGWRLARLGRITASDFERLITPTGKVARGTTVNRLCAEKVAEWILGHELDSKETEAMAWGKTYEQRAVESYQIETGLDAVPVGLCLLDDGSVGASPDRLVGSDGLLEVKCPFSHAVHAGYLLDPSLLETAYRPQVQGQLWVTGRKWCDLYAWHEIMPTVRVRVVADPEWEASLSDACADATARIEAAKKSLLARGVVSHLEVARRNAKEPTKFATTPDEFDAVFEAAGLPPKERK